MRIYFILVLLCCMISTKAQVQGLYFMLNGTSYQNGDTVLITNIGLFLTPENAASSLVCRTNNVNTNCCRSSDGGNLGEWFFPNGSIVRRNSGNETYDFTRTGFTHEVRLNRRNNARMPAGQYSCRVPDGVNLAVATITLMNINMSIPAMLSASEDDQVVSVCVTLSITPSTAIISRAIRVSLNTSDGSATAGSDYTPQFADLTFSAGFTDGAMQCMDIRIINDIEQEENETIHVALTTSDTQLLGNNASTITIINVHDVDECLANTDDCDINAQCTNTFGSFTCTCNQGYSGNGHEERPEDAQLSCQDIDECNGGIDDCDTNALCTNTPGSFNCTCGQGYSGNGIHCIIATPVVFISVPHGPLVAGEMMNATLNCSATIDQAVLNRGRILYNFTWLNGTGNPIVSGDRTTVLPDPSSLSPLPFSTLTLSPVSTVDTNVTCGVTVQQNRTTASEPGVLSTLLNITIPANPVVEVVGINTSAIAGNNYTLTCTVTLLQQLRETPIIVWAGPDGAQIGNGTIADVTVSQISPLTELLTFSPLHTDYGGEYRCRASVDIAEAGVSITNSTIFNITVQIPPPTVTITGLPIDSEFLRLTCSILIPQQLHSQPVVVTAHWTRAGFTIANNTHVTVGVVEKVGALLYQSTVVFNSLDGSRDSGEYTCTGSINTSISVSAIFTISIHTIFFQLELTGIVSNCQEWRSEDLSAKDEDLTNALVEHVMPRCGCDFSDNRLTNRVFQCFPSSPNSVTYHAQLHGTLNSNASELFMVIEDWVSTGATIPIQLLPLTVVNVCAVNSSIPLQHCSGETITEPATLSSTTGSSPGINDAIDTGNNILGTTPIIIIASVGGVIAIATAIAIIAALTACKRHRHSGSSWQMQMDNCKSTRTNEENVAYGVDNCGVDNCPPYSQSMVIHEESKYATISARKDRKEKECYSAIPMIVDESSFTMAPKENQITYAAIAPEENYAAVSVIKEESGNSTFSEKNESNHAATIESTYKPTVLEEKELTENESPHAAVSSPPNDNATQTTKKKSSYATTPEVKIPTYATISLETKRKKSKSAIPPTPIPPTPKEELEEDAYYTNMSTTAIAPEENYAAVSIMKEESGNAIYPTDLEFTQNESPYAAISSPPNDNATQMTKKKSSYATTPEVKIPTYATISLETKRKKSKSAIPPTPIPPTSKEELEEDIYYTDMSTTEEFDPAQGDTLYANTSEIKAEVFYHASAPVETSEYANVSELIGDTMPVEEGEKSEYVNVKELIAEDIYINALV